MQQTETIHFTGNFLTWHRWFLYSYEQALRQECGYKGYAPYWDWLKWADAPEKSPIFNGDAYSLGGNGKYIPHNGTILLPPPGVPGDPIPLPAGYGSGCVETGPFIDFKVNLGPIALPASIPAANPFAYNPRCMKRDVGPGLAAQWHTPRIMLGKCYSTSSQCITNLCMTDVLTSKTLADFRAVFEGIPYTANLGPHGAGHL
jgi:tyrosinase